MKNLSLFFISILALATFSCKREEVQQNGGLVTITANQKSSPDLKTNIGAAGTTAVSWNATDNLAVFDATGGNVNKLFSYTAGAGTQSGTFSGTISSWTTGQEKIFNAVYPYDPDKDLKEYGSYQFSIPSTQTQDFTSEATKYAQLGQYDFMAASPVTVTKTGDAQPAINFTFQHLMAILDIEVTNSTGAAVTVTKISVKRLMADFITYASLNLSTPPDDPGFFSVASTLEQLDLNVANNGTPTGAAGKFTGSMIVAPVDLSGDNTSFVVTVSGGAEYVVTKTNGPKMIAGKRYKAQITISSPGFVDSRDNKAYKTVTIGTQIWMAENLAWLPAVVGPATSSDALSYYYVFGYDGTVVAAAKATDSYNTYGVLYNWPAAKAACPAGWHLPTDAEFTTLTTFLGGGGVAGGPLKETGTTHWTSQSAGTTNSSGFTALPGGRSYNGAFDYLGLRAYFWSASENGTLYAWGRYLNYNYDGVYRLDYYRTVGFSVRCLQNN